MVGRFTCACGRCGCRTFTANAYANDEPLEGEADSSHGTVKSMMVFVCDACSDPIVEILTDAHGVVTTTFTGRCT